MVHQFWPLEQHIVLDAWILTSVSNISFCLSNHIFRVLRAPYYTHSILLSIVRTFFM